jgi:two-component system cell cycle response regulator
MATVLVIDDDESSLTILVSLVCAAGHTAFGVPSGRDALRNGDYAAPDLILCDVLMPGMDGREVMREFRYLGLRRVPIVAVTALRGESHREELLAAGFDGYIPKPIEGRTFAAQIESFLNPGCVPVPGEIVAHAER